MWIAVGTMAEEVAWRVIVVLFGPIEISRVAPW
jgi:hypothetical protein